MSAIHLAGRRFDLRPSLHPFCSEWEWSLGEFSDVNQPIGFWVILVASKWTPNGPDDEAVSALGLGVHQPSKSIQISPNSCKRKRAATF